MLVTFDISAGGTVTDPKALSINYLRCVKAIATASASSTPSVTPLTGPSALGAGNCIVSVISNTEAGGWTASSSDTTPTTSYNASNASIPSYITDLYVQNTGKTTYPYQKVTFATNPSYAFSNASYPTYPKITAYHFASATSSATVSMPLTFDANYPQYHLNDTTTVAAHLVSPASCLAANNSATLFHTMACTENYIHIIHSYYILSCGYRETQAWEANYNNNPPIYGFGVSTITDVAVNPDAAYAWMRSISGSGSVNTAYTFGNNHSVAAAGTYTNSVTGYTKNNGAVTAGYIDLLAARNGGGATAGARNGLVPLMLLSGLDDPTYKPSSPIIGPNTDANGAWVPPAIPINISMQSYNSSSSSLFMNTGGKVKGLYKSLSNGKGQFTMSNFYTAGATYTVDGDSYYPVLGGRGYDLFLVRKA
jgi:hypothetical protein